MTTLIVLAMVVGALRCLTSAAQWKPAVALLRQAGLSSPRVKQGGSVVLLYSRRGFPWNQMGDQTILLSLPCTSTTSARVAVD